MKKLTRKVGLLLENNQGKILVLKTDRGWGLVEGHFESGESVSGKLIQIIKDTIDYSVTSDKLNFIDVYHLKRPALNQKYSLFYYKIIEDKPSLNPGKSGNPDSLWATPSELLQRPDLGIGMPQFLQALSKIQK